VVVQLKAQNAALEMELRVKVRPFSTPPAFLPACVSSVVCCTLHIARCVLHWKTRVRYTSQAGRQRARARARVCALRARRLWLVVVRLPRRARSTSSSTGECDSTPPARPTASVASRSSARRSCRKAQCAVRRRRQARSAIAAEASFGGLLCCVWFTGWSRSATTLSRRVRPELPFPRRDFSVCACMCACVCACVCVL
jgi:hypothetical protein